MKILEKYNLGWIEGVVFHIRHSFASLSLVKGGTTALVLGGIASFGFPPSCFLAAYIFSFILFLWLLDETDGRFKSWITGFCFGFGYFGFGLYWINNAIIFYAPEILPLVILCFLGCGIWGGFYVSLCSLGVAFFRKGLPRFIAFAALWTVAEYLRSVLFTGFAWNLTASIWDNDLPMLQSVAYVGSYGLGLFTMLIIAAAASAKKIPLIAAVIALTLLYVGGVARIKASEYDIVGNKTAVRIVQPSLPESLHPNKKDALNKFNEHLKLSVSDLPNNTSYIIWSETAMPFSLQQDNAATVALKQSLPDDVFLITGFFRRDNDKVFNSAAVIQNGNLIDTYDKSHLVPFGEYVPWKKYLPFQKFTSGFRDLSAGGGVSTLTLPNNDKVGLLICYEVIFPAAVADKKHRPDFLVNLTFDGWYGESAGPYQHFAAARLRAIEEGLPLIRAAGSGISGIISPLGEATAWAGLNEKTVIDGYLPLAMPETFYGKYGNSVPLFLVFLTLAGAIFYDRYGRRKENGIQKQKNQKRLGN